MKVIEVMYCCLLGCFIFGCWEIDVLFDIVVCYGFYGVVDVLIDSKDYSEVFGVDIVFYECFIIFGDVIVCCILGWLCVFNFEVFVDFIFSSCFEI